MAKTVMLAIGHEELEEELIELQSKGVFTVIESDPDMDLLADSLHYMSCDFIIANSLLSKAKLVRLASAAKEICGERTRLIVLIENFEDREFISHLVGLGVYSFHLITNLSTITQDIEEYPEEFDFRLLVEQEKGKAEPIISRARTMGTISFGIFSVNSGAGSTSFAWALAMEIADNGYNVVMVDLSGSRALQKMPGKRRITVLCPDGKQPGDKEALLQVAYSSMEQPFIIFDFGKLFEFEYQTDKDTPMLKHAERESLDDFLRCNYKIGVGFAESWHSYPLTFFKTDLFLSDTQAGQFHFLLSAADEKTVAKTEEMMGLPVWNRSHSADFIAELMKRAGIQTSQTQRTVKFSFLRRRK